MIYPKTDIIEAHARLHKWLKPGDTIYCILRHCSRSGMSRDISLLTFTTYNGRPEPIHLNYSAATILGRAMSHRDGHDAIKIGGSGMDMGFALVYELSHALFPDGFIPSEAGHTYGRNGYSADTLDTDGGFALTHKWL